MQQLAATIREGWPDLKSQVSANLAPYWNFCEQLTLEEDLIFKNDKVIIPASLTKLMLTKVHQSHQGIEKTKRLARGIMFWPNMSAQITDMVSRCPICSANQHKNRKEPMVPHEFPLRPWQKVGSDLFEIGTEQYMVLVDYYSNFIEVNKLASTKSSAVITCCKQQFSQYGIPDELITDNGPQFTSAEFRQFTKDYGIKHTCVQRHHRCTPSPMAEQKKQFR
ncbi:uncharacterized protein K02A2.6-like [Patiria miniata]|uniref:Integrase catalytic domain-containing protein n=1 Tax=Patiria miniata TaxID=46514 RepID=A0A914AFV6_PATMI|nr:uncharacterized protein K02A2.6-like [Patiria miniata]